MPDTINRRCQNCDLEFEWSQSKKYCPHCGSLNLSELEQRQITLDPHEQDEEDEEQEEEVQRNDPEEIRAKLGCTMLIVWTLMVLAIVFFIVAAVFHVAAYTSEGPGAVTFKVSGGSVVIIQEPLHLDDARSLYEFKLIHADHEISGEVVAESTNMEPGRWQVVEGSDIQLTISSEETGFVVYVEMDPVTKFLITLVTLALGFIVWIWVSSAIVQTED